MTNVVQNLAIPSSNDLELTKQVNAMVDAYVVGFGKALKPYVRTDSDEELLGHITATYRRLRPGARAWSPELGVARTYLRSGDPRSALIQAAIHATCACGSGAWETTLDAPRTFLAHDRPLSLSGRISVEFRENKLRIQAQDRTFTRDSDGLWESEPQSADGHVSHACGYLERGTNPLRTKFVLPLLRNPNAAPDGSDREHTAILEEIDLSSQDFADYAATQFVRAYALIDRALPAYSLFTRLLVRGFGVIASIDGRKTSGTSLDFQGFLTCTLPGTLDWVAETIVHEAAHQYYMLLDSMFALTAPDDGKLYYSSIKQAPRSLKRQLIGYHAVANMVLFFRALAKEGVPTQARTNRLAELEKYAATMRQEIADATTFTSDGKIFVEELNRHLDS
jgi:hypothetical protein